MTRLVPVLVAVALLAGPAVVHAQTAHVDSIPMIKVPSQMPQLEPIIIKGKEFTTRDLVKRAMKGERSKLAGHADAIYLVTSNVSFQWDDKKEVETHVTRVYADSTGTSRRLLLGAKAQKYKKKDGQWVFDKEEDAHNQPFRIQDFDEGRFTSIPVYLERDEEFDFEYIERRLEKDHVVFHVRFKPKSDFSEMPRGEIWIDGNGFRVVHEIYDFTKNPFPMLIKGVRRISVQWTELAGGEWVPRQIAAEVEMRRAPLVPHSISFKQTWEDFRFDQGYDERLFGKRDAESVAIAPKPPVVPRVPVPADTAVTDSLGVSAVVPDSLSVYQADTTAVETGLSWLPQLQQEDDAAYSSEVQITNRAFIDSTAALHDSLGVEGLGDDIALYGSEWKLGFDPRLERWDYNRVEGFVFGGEGSFGRADDRSKLSVWGGYATASEEFRYRGAFTTEVPKTDRKLSLTLSARNAAEPFGSNQVALNSLRAFVGGADDQNYVDRNGWLASLTLAPWDDISFDAGYESAQDREMQAETDFSVFGDMDEPNVQADFGTDRALFAGFRLEGRRWLNAQLSHRWTDEAFGPQNEPRPEFSYHRTDLMLNVRGFILGRQEFDLTLRGVATSGAVPVQRQADIGGLSTVRGYAPRTLVGDYTATARLEYLFPYDVFASTKIPLLKDAGIQFIPWGDTGVAVVESFPEEWISSAGLGLQRYLWPFGNAANLRLDFAWPLDNPEDDFAVYLWFTALR